MGGSRMTLLQTCKEILARLDEGASVDDVNALIRQSEKLAREKDVKLPLHFETYTEDDYRTVTLYLNDPKSSVCRAFCVASYVREGGVWYPLEGSDRDWELLVRKHLALWVRHLASPRKAKLHPETVRRRGAPRRYDPKETQRVWKRWQRMRERGAYRTRKAFAEAHCEEYGCNVKFLLGMIESGRKRLANRADSNA